MAPSKHRVVDVHTHMYPPSYIRMLEKRDTIPVVRSIPGQANPRLILLEAEVEAMKAYEGDPSAKLPGRPLTPDFTSLERKIQFMDAHSIDTSVISLANPWVDFVKDDPAYEMAIEVNTEFNDMCALYPGRLFFFAVLPVKATLDHLLSTIDYCKALKYCRGVILGTSGSGQGLDDPALLGVFEALSMARMPVFLHPHYGLPNELWGPRASAEYGHVLPLALGFPMETTIAVTRMYLAGVFDKVRDLRMLLAHSGGTLPFLAGRIESCILHDGQLGKVKGRRTIWEVLKEQIYLDAVVYSEVGLKAAIEASGSDRLMFGTDHPFFPPITTDDKPSAEQDEWESVTMNVAAVTKAVGEGSETAKAIMGSNAVKELRLEID